MDEQTITYLLIFVFTIMGFTLFYMYIRSPKSINSKITEDEQKYIDNFLQKYPTSLDELKKSYIDINSFHAFSERWRKTFEIFRNNPAISKKYGKVQTFIDTHSDLRSNIDNWNDEFVNSEMFTKGSEFAYINRNELDMQQKAAAVTNEVNTLVIAGAGSGKTLTIIGKIQYLVNVLHVNPEKILLLAYNKKAADELTMKLESANIALEANTFHKFGLKVIDNSTKTFPKVANEALLTNVVMDYMLNAKYQDKERALKILMFLGLYSLPMENQEDYNSAGDYIEQIRGADLESLKSKYYKTSNKSTKSLQGEQMRSIEETLIANFLFLNGVEYEYEPSYSSIVPDCTIRYNPDFYLPEYNIFIEHFGITKNNTVPWLSPIDEEMYISYMYKKRETHKKYGTKLIESYSYWKSDGAFIDKIDNLLKTNGVKYKDVDLIDIYNKIYSHKQEQSFVDLCKLLSSFIRLFKENGTFTITELKWKCISNNYFDKRASLFFEIFEPIYKRYQKTLEQNNEIDFSDMIATATKLIKSSGSPERYEYIIADEFQDISRGRAELIKAVIKATNAKFMCVGDDWQSIYKFAGSDVDFITNFEKHFGYTKVLNIEKTYRYSNQLISVMEPFILKNPAQRQKRMKSEKNLSMPVQIVYFSQKKEEALNYAVETIIKEFGENKNIGLLMRNGFDLDFLSDSKNWTKVKTTKGERFIKYKYRKYPSVDIMAITVHSAKGLEVDNVIVVNAQNHMIGFPNKMNDDPILQLLLASSDSYDYAEERRLFYVALTRTKNKSFLIVPEKNPSLFVKELLRSSEVKVISPTDENLTINNPVCPVCKTGHLLIRKNADGKEFIGCSNYPICTRTYNDVSLMRHAIKCPSCGGYMVHRKGPYGEFFGCSNYPLCKTTMQSHFS